MKVLKILKSRESNVNIKSISIRLARTPPVHVRNQVYDVWKRDGTNVLVVMWEGIVTFSLHQGVDNVVAGVV